MSEAASTVTRTPHPGLRLLSWCNGIGVLLVGSAIAMATPRFTDVFADFGTELPLITIWVLKVPASLWIFGGVAGGTVTVAMDYGLRSKAARFAFQAAIGIVMLLGILCVGLALSLPLLRLVESI